MNYKERVLRLLPFGLILISLMSCKGKEEVSDPITLKDAFKDNFLIGAALNTNQSSGQNMEEAKLVKTQFNTIVAENCMKHEEIHPEQYRFNFKDADELVAFGEENNMFVVGHCLVWHSQTAPWMFKDTEGNTVSRDTLIERMKNHIHTIVGRYKGRVHGWDVVNEALNEDEGLRKSPWTEIIGEDFLELAFKFAHEADPDAELYYNDYNMYKPSKREAAVKLVGALKESGCRVDGIGMQAHYGLDNPELEDIENSILAYSGIGCKVMITELDISVLPFPEGKLTAEISTSYANSPIYNPYSDGLPDTTQLQLSQRYLDLFKIYLKHHDKISRLTFWGVNNGNSWRNNWPVNGRTDYPLLFDRKNNMVPAGDAIIRLATKE